MCARLEVGVTGDRDDIIFELTELLYTLDCCAEIVELIIIHDSNHATRRADLQYEV